MKHLLTILIAFWIIGVSYGQTRLAPLFTDHMVLQRNSIVSIWGWSNAGEEVSLKVSWEAECYQTICDAESRWEIAVPTPAAGGPYQLTLNDSIVIHDVLIGEVWICSGQSNMEWSALYGIDQAKKAIRQANNNQIRLFTVPQVAATEPQSACEGTWSRCSSETMASFSAVAYFFGKTLEENLNVPIGLIHSSWGGTPAENWTPRAIIDGDAEFSNWVNTFEEDPYRPINPSVLYNGMIHPLIPFEIAGVIWYQGEANTENPFVYRRLFPAMIESWRSAWEKDFPFYYVQIAPFKYEKPLVGALVQEAQLMAMSTKNVGMVVTNDIGEINDIHPQNKLDVGKRLAYWALNKTYGKDLEYAGPLYQSMEQEGDQLRIHFDYSDGLHLIPTEANYFLIAGADEVFYPAHVVIEANTLIAKHPMVTNPVSLRYAFSNTASGNLFNATGLPASPFRTDDWPIVFEEVDISMKRVEEGMIISMESETPNTNIRYTLDGSRPGPAAQKYIAPLRVDDDVEVQAVAVQDGNYSMLISSRSFVLNEATFSEVDLVSGYSEHYPSSGKNALSDGAIGSLSFKDGNWQGFNGTDLNLTIDLGEQKTIKTIRTHFLQDQNVWIFLPTAVEFSVSTDNIHFEVVGQQRQALRQDKTIEISTSKVDFSPKEVRYIRIKARSIQQCPKWHPGYGGTCWLFVDEVEAE